MSRLCYPCIVELSSVTGKASVGDGDGYGPCTNCGVHRRLYRQKTLYGPEPIWFGWSLAIMVIGFVLAILLLSQKP